ncbi:MAG: hypothetical protein KDB21_18180 [Acidimicrobiales bacterium]|nr:hypothetical protein [Acidimicrobiales bacterium]
MTGSGDVSTPPPCDLLARLTGRPVLLLDFDGFVREAGGARSITLPERVGRSTDLRRMARSTNATPATWTIDGREWRVFGMRWPAPEPLVLVRLVPRDSSAFSLVSQRLAALEQRQIEVRSALGRALVAEAETLAALDQLTATNRELEGYAALVAHDLRAPIRTARLLADRAVATSGPDGDPSLVVELGGRLVETLGRLDALVLRLLDYASLREQSFDVAQHAVADIVTTAVSDLGCVLTESGADLVIDAAGAIACDSALLSVVIRELVLNAIKYRDPDRAPRVVVTATEGHASCTITVSDNGTGIPEHQRDTAFEMFQRLRSDTTDGLGFGLAYCRRIIELHGGSIELGTGIGGLGTSVAIRLPTARSVDRTILSDRDPEVVRGGADVRRDRIERCAVDRVGAQEVVGQDGLCIGERDVVEQLLELGWGLGPGAFVVGRV